MATPGRGLRKNTGKELKMTDFKEISTSKHEVGEKGRVTTYKVTQLIWLITGILIAMLGLRFLFKLIGVNEASIFATFLYGLTGVFLVPFDSLVGDLVAGRSVLEFTTLIAMVVYALIGWALERLVYVAFYRPRGQVSLRQTVVDQHIPPPTKSETSIQTTTSTTSSDDQNETTDQK